MTDEPVTFHPVADEAALERLVGDGPFLVLTPDGFQLHSSVDSAKGSPETVVVGVLPLRSVRVGRSVSLATEAETLSIFDYYRNLTPENHAKAKEELKRRLRFHEDGVRIAKTGCIEIDLGKSRGEA